MAGSTPNQFGVKGKDIPFKSSTAPNPVKHMPGTDNLRVKVQVKRAEKQGK